MFYILTSAKIFAKVYCHCMNDWMIEWTILKRMIGWEQGTRPTMSPMQVSSINTGLQYMSYGMSCVTSHITCHKSQETALDPLCDTILEMSWSQLQHGTSIHVTGHIMYHMIMISLWITVHFIHEIFIPLLNWSHSSSSSFSSVTNFASGCDWLVDVMWLHSSISLVHITIHWSTQKNFESFYMFTKMPIS